jgi:hypothetical protein
MQFALTPRETVQDLAWEMVDKGWQPVFCLARQSGSFTPQHGSTGGSAPYGWDGRQPDGAHRLAFRPPTNVVVFDVDHYDGKRGADTIDAAEARLGPLPLTWKVSSRGDENPSGRYLFRKPVDLDFTDSALSAFGTDGVTNVEIVRTAHRFSWAPGDINHKNGQVVMCFDPDGEPGKLPNVNDLPELPEAWVAYLRNPPVPQTAMAYNAPCDGPEWWLAQADDSLGTRQELAGFGMKIMNSRQPVEVAMEQMLRCSLALDPARPWRESDLWPLLDTNTQRKVAENLARQDFEYEFVKDQSHATDEQLTKEAERTQEEYQRKKAFDEAAKQRLQAVTNFVVEQKPGIPICFDPDDPDFEPEPQVTTANFHDMIRGLPVYKQEVGRMLARKIAEKDVRDLLKKEFKGFQDITQQQEIPEPERLQVVGKDQKSSAVIPRKTVSVLSGHRASGKTWVAAAFAAQEMRADRHVIWVDFERQPALLREKLKICGIVSDEVVRNQLHYTDELPPDLAFEAAQYPDCLIVIDAWRGLQQDVAPATSANDGDAVEQVYADVLNPAVGVGATIVILDHLAKTGIGGTFGSERKESAADYVFKVEQLQAFSRKSEGYSAMTVTKDRYGHHTVDTAVAYLWVPAGDSGGPSIKDYPRMPELRNWSPVADEVPTPGEVLNGDETPAKTVKQPRERTSDEDVARRDRAILAIVGEEPLKYGQRELSREVWAQYPEIFASDEAVRSPIKRLKRTGHLIADSSGKFEVRQSPIPTPTTKDIDLSLPEDSDEDD